MRTSVHSRDVEEQLEEALPILGAAALKRALAGLHILLAASRNPVHQKLIIWLWATGYERLGSISLERASSGLRIWLPDDGGDLAAALGDSEIRVDIDPVTATPGRYTVAASLIECNARAAAASLLSHLDELEAKRTRQEERKSRQSGRQSGKPSL